MNYFFCKWRGLFNFDCVNVILLLWFNSLNYQHHPLKNHRNLLGLQAWLCRRDPLVRPNWLIYMLIVSRGGLCAPCFILQSSGCCRWKMWENLDCICLTETHALRRLLGLNSYPPSILLWLLILSSFFIAKPVCRWRHAIKMSHLLKAFLRFLRSRKYCFLNKIVYLFIW